MRASSYRCSLLHPPVFFSSSPWFLSEPVALRTNLPAALLSARIVRRDDKEVDDDNDNNVNDTGTGTSTSTDDAKGSRPAAVPPPGLPPWAVVYEVLEFGNARVTTANFFMEEHSGRVLTVRARFDPYDENYRAYDDYSPTGDITTTLNYEPAYKLVKIVVQQPPPPSLVLEWAAPVPVMYGTMLGARQFDASLVRR